MKCLVTARQVLTWLCVFSAKEHPNKWKYYYIVFSLTVFVLMLSCVLASATFFFAFLHTDLVTSLYAPLYLSGYIIAVYGYLTLMILRKDLRALFENLDKIYEDGKQLKTICEYF